MVYTDNLPSLYINGTLVKTGIRGDRQFVYPTLNIGGEGYGYYQGAVDELRYWSGARTQAQIQAQMSKHLEKTSSAPVTYLTGAPQRHVTNRVSFTYLDEDGSPATLTDRTTTYYSYDAHGNVEWLIQEIPSLGKKYLRYEYDLISGKVLRVNYQENQPDQFYHRYAYDADNRITAVHTSADGQIWDPDATYQYYAHGPLQRTVLGEDQVQGLDYTYTLQGWLKGLNHPALAADPGQDGTGSSKVGRDAFGMSLGYYAGDYQRTGHALSSEILGANHAPATGKSLYNGNIAAWSSGHFYQVAGAARQTVAAERFSYDELNQIKTSSYTELGATRNA